MVKTHEPLALLVPPPGRSARPRPAETGGPISKSAVVAGMNGVKEAVASCYHRYGIPGLVMVNVSIGPGGNVTNARVTGRFAGTLTAACVDTAVRAASFPPSDGLTTLYPFTLR